MNKRYLIENLEEWIMEQKYQEYSINTLKQYKANVQKFIDWLPGEDVPITKDITIEYKKYLTDKSISTSSINTWIVTINKYFRWLKRDDLTIKKLKVQHKSSNEEVLTIADYKRLLRFSKRLGYDDLYLIMKVLAMTGIRISGLKYFTVENITSNYITANTKHKYNKIIIRQDLGRELRKYCRDNKIKSGYIFTAAKDSSKLKPNNTIWWQMKKVAGASRVNKKKVHAHSFRHLFANMFLDEYPDNVTELADILGHSSLETTRIYTKSSDSQKRSKLEKLKY